MFLGLISNVMLAWATYLHKNPIDKGSVGVLGASNLLETLKGLDAKPKKC